MLAVLSGVQALLFDVFGTVVDWHGHITHELAERAPAESTSYTDESCSFYLLQTFKYH